MVAASSSECVCVNVVRKQTRPPNPAPDRSIRVLSGQTFSSRATVRIHATMMTTMHHFWKQPRPFYIALSAEKQAHAHSHTAPADNNLNDSLPESGLARSLARSLSLDALISSFMHSRHLLFRSAHQIFCGKFRSPELESDQQFENAERRYAGRGGKARRFDLRGSNSIVAEKAADSARLAFSGTSLFQLQHHISKLEFFCDPKKASLISNHEHQEEMSSQ